MVRSVAEEDIHGNVLIPTVDIAHHGKAGHEMLLVKR
jgi:hypothetical protein